jgi:prevent-host-death family protein
LKHAFHAGIVACVTTLLYKIGMPSKPIRISEARKQLSRLVERVASGGAPVTIGRYGREGAVLVSAEEYRRLKNSTPAKPPLTLEGTMTLECSPAELIAESRRLGELWLAAIDRTEKRRTPVRRSSAK